MAATATTTPTSTGTATATSNDNTLGMLAHVLLIFTWWVGPLILWIVKKEQGPSHAVDNAKEALNFGILLTIVYIATWILTAVTFGLLFFLPFLVMVAALVFGILGALDANKGNVYRYPLSLRLIK